MMRLRCVIPLTHEWSHDWPDGCICPGDMRRPNGHHTVRRQNGPALTLRIPTYDATAPMVIPLPRDANELVLDTDLSTNACGYPAAMTSGACRCSTLRKARG